jgi:hypothetical protein
MLMIPDMDPEKLFPDPASSKIPVSDIQQVCLVIFIAINFFLCD